MRCHIFIFIFYFFYYFSFLMSESKNEDNKDAFVNFKFLEEVRETPEYKNAKERIDLIEGIFSIIRMNKTTSTGENKNGTPPLTV